MPRRCAASTAELAGIADARGHARMIEVVEQGDCELARRAEEVAIDCRGYLGMSLQIAGEVLLRRIERGAREIEIRRDLDHLALALEGRQHAAKFRDLTGR